MRPSLSLRSPAASWTKTAERSSSVSWAKVAEGFYTAGRANSPAASQSLRTLASEMNQLQSENSGKNSSSKSKSNKLYPKQICSIVWGMSKLNTRGQVPQDSTFNSVSDFDHSDANTTIQSQNQTFRHFLDSSYQSLIKDNFWLSLSFSPQQRVTLIESYCRLASQA